MDDATFLKYKQVYFGWARKHWSSVSTSALEDVFLDALAVYVEYNQRGKVNVQATTFIIAVAHRKLAQTQQQQPLKLKTELIATTDEWPAQKELVRTALKQLDDKCRQILTAKYFYNASMEEIMQETNAKSRAVVRTQKKRCIQKLRAIVLDLQKAV